MDLTKILEAIITLAVVLVAYFIIPTLKAKVSQESFDQLQTWVKIAVQAAEMIFTESGLGSKKKEYVKNFLESKNLYIDEEALNNLIESAVLELKRAAND